MLYECPRCKETYGAYRLRHTTSHRPVEDDVVVEFCPVCGLWLKEGLEEEIMDNIVVDEFNLFDKVERYSNCIVEILSNSVTGESSIGWYKTEDTEELE